jgi:hypothetical protein
MAKYNVTYNNYNFPYAKVTATETPSYANDRITLEGTIFNITVTGFLTGVSAHDFANQLEIMRCQVTEPRESLLIQWSDDGVTYYNLYNFSSGAAGPFADVTTADQEFGPFPGDLRVTKFMGGKSGIYTWSVRVFQKACFDGGCNQGVGSGEILSITRKYQFDVDSVGLTTRTLSGTLTVRGNKVLLIDAQNGIPADNYRLIVTPPLPTDFTRKRQSFSQSEDGRQLNFSFTDVEQKYVLPSPITDGNATFMTRVEQTGAMVRYNLSGWFAAPVSVQKGVILFQVFTLISAYFPQSTGAQPVIFESREITDDIYNNRISFNISAFQAYATTADGIPDFSIGLSPMNQAAPLGVGQQQGQNYLVYPYGGDVNRSSGILADPPVLYDECATGVITNNSLPKNPLSNNSSAGGSAPNQPSFSGNLPQETPVQAPSNGATPAHLAAPYIAYHERWSWELDNKIKVFTPKIIGQDPIIQQTGLPQITVIQAGYSTQVAPASNLLSPPPQPIYPASIGAAVVQIATIDNSVPEPVGDGANYKWTQHWRYVMRIAYAVDNTNNGPQLLYPQDPRTQTQNNNTTFDIGKVGIIVDPTGKTNPPYANPNGTNNSQNNNN